MDCYSNFDQSIWGGKETEQIIRLRISGNGIIPLSNSLTTNHAQHKAVSDHSIEFYVGVTNK